MGFTDILKAADRRLGRERLVKKYVNAAQNGPVWKILNRRFDLSRLKSFDQHASRTESFPSLENYIRGPGRDEAFALAEEFYEARKGEGSPFIIIGRSGDGKTYLSAAIRAKVRESPATKVFCGNAASSSRPSWFIPYVSHIFLDDLSHFLFSAERDEKTLKRIEERLRNGALVLLVCVGTAADGTRGKLLARWPGAKIAEIGSPTMEQKIELATYSAPHVGMKVLYEICKKSTTLREVEGWIMRYEACRKLGEPFNLGEGY